MMPIPCKMNPFGKSNKPTAFELVVKPGILAADMTYGFTPYWNSGGYCSVDWGDGQKEDAVKGDAALNHTYAEAGTYKIKIKAECYQVRFDTTGKTLIYSCSETLDNLGDLTSGGGMFQNCTNAQLKFTNLPKNLKQGYWMFSGCSKAHLPLTSLPSGLTSVGNMFNGCTNAQLPLTSLPEGVTNGNSTFYGCTNAQLSLTSLPEGLTNGSSMFQGCSNATLPLTSLPDSLTTGHSMFYGCTNAQLHLTELPNGLKNCSAMFYKCSSAKLEIRKLPDGLTSASSMFEQCKNAEINLDELVANAPAEGWTQLTTISYMFNGSTKVTGSRSAFLAKCPNVTGTTRAFDGTSTTE